MSLRATQAFNRPDRFIEGWYWALESTQLSVGKVCAVRLQGRDLVVFRTDSGRAVAMDAHCPHMGAHLADGRVEGEGIRCFFHNWKFDAKGHCVDVPCLERAPKSETRTWPVAERYGLIWVWTGESPATPVPFVPEYGEGEVDARVAGTFVKECHPGVMMINAIDEHHFNTVHSLPVPLYMKSQAMNQNVMTFSNTSKLPDTNPVLRALGKFYAGPLTYSMCYWFGSTGSVTVGPDFMHFHIMFSLRMLDGGRSEGKTVLITRKRSGVAGKALSQIALALSKVVGDYFATGDTQVFKTIKFDFKTPTKADHAIVDFIRHVEGQKPRRYGTWEPVDEARVSLAVQA